MRPIHKAVAAAAGILAGAFLMQHEDIRTVPYRDSVGVLTVCVGETAAIYVNQPQTRASCERILGQRLTEYAEGVSSGIVVALSVKQFGALISFCYNVGLPSCKRSEAFRLINQGRYREGGLAMLNWYKAGGRDCRVRANNCYGMWLRRQAEVQLFLEGT